MTAWHAALALLAVAPPPPEPPGPNVTLLTGAQMPLVGFGCAGRMGASTLIEAVGAGYRLFDTAQAHEWYDEAALGEALALAGRPRAFIITKVHPRDFGRASTPAALERSLARLRVPTLDLVLLHYPACWGALCEGAPAPEGGWREAWRALEAAQAAGSVRALGVSNFGLAELRQLWAFAARPASRPAVVQSMMDPFVQGAQLRAWCGEHGAVFQAYSSLGTQHALGSAVPNPVLSSALLQAVAQRAGRSVAQVVLRWALHRGAAVLPRSSHAGRMRENLRLFDFDLLPAELAAIDALDGTDPRRAERAPPPRDAPVHLRFVNGRGQPLRLSWAGAAEPAWALAPLGSLELQSYAGHAFSAAAQHAPAVALWRWTVPTPADGQGEPSAPLTVLVAPVGDAGRASADGTDETSGEERMGGVGAKAEL